MLDLFSCVLGALLGDESLNLSMDTVRGDVTGWDSFQYVNFIAAIEMELGIKFRVADVEAFQTVGDIAQAALELRNAS